MSNSIFDDINSVIESLHQVIRQGLESSTEQHLSEVNIHKLFSETNRNRKQECLEKFLRLQMECDDNDKYHQHNHRSCNISEIQ